MKSAWSLASSFSLSLLSLSIGCSRSDTSRLQEAPDSANAVSLFDLKEMPDYATIAANTRVETTKQPWSDTYWPFVNRGLARRWFVVSPDYDTKLGFVSYWQDQKNLPLEKYSYLSPAEKYDFIYRLRWNIPVDQAAIDEELLTLAAREETYSAEASLQDKREVLSDLNKIFLNAGALAKSSPLSYESWKNWLNFNQNPNYKLLAEKDSGEDWGWMGYCHGWAAAAVMTDPPKHAVLASIKGQEMLFSEGDIRGLLTKAWADHSPLKDNLFLGRRCNLNTDDPNAAIPSGKDGRGLSGIMRGSDNKVRSFIVVDEYLTTSPERRVYQVLFIDKDQLSFVAEEKKPNKATSYYSSPDLTKIRAFVSEGKTDGLSSIGSLSFYGCWDVNPASFHTVLLEYIGKRNKGVVFDRTRTGQVWNQPIRSAEFTISELMNAADVEDKSFRYRAMGTEYLATVKARLFWSTEPGSPSFDYPDDFDAAHMASSTYFYTLEFDANKRLIGGEWGDFGSIRPEQPAPDFIYTYRDGSRPVDDLSRAFDYSGIIGPLLRCSQADENVETTMLNGSLVPFTRCALGAAN